MFAIALSIIEIFHNMAMKRTAHFPVPHDVLLKRPRQRHLRRDVGGLRGGVERHHAGWRSCGCHSGGGTIRQTTINIRTCKR